MGTDSPNIREDKLPPPNTEPSQAWNWQPPDLSEISTFYKTRLTNLKLAVESLGNGYEYFLWKRINHSQTT